MKRIVVHCEQNTMEAALFVDEELTEYFSEKNSKRLAAGSFYKGRVTNVLQGMQAVFVDIGQKKNAFLYIDDLLPAAFDPNQAKPPIGDLIKVGQEILVQVTKEAVGQKGARVTTHYALPGRWIVYMPHSDYIGISRKIESEEERNRLKLLGEQLRLQGEGLIVRTVAENASKQTIYKDLTQLRELWDQIQKRAEQLQVPSCVYVDLDIFSRLTRDLFTDQVNELWIDDGRKARELMVRLQEIAPHLVERIHIYEESVPIKQKFGIEEELKRSFQSKIWLKNGGYLVFDRTEALTVIDVNTGKFTGSVDLEQTVFETNLEAAKQIVRLIRLRDIGGIIIVDFIDMSNEKNRNYILHQMNEWFKEDRTKTIVLGWTQLGLLEITRKKTGNNHGIGLEDSDVCPVCQGTGKINSLRD